MGKCLNRRDILVGSGATLLTLSALGKPASGMAADAKTSLPTALAGAAGIIAIGPDLKVNRMGFGAMRITGAEEWGPPADPAAMKRLLRRVVELGVDFIDSAHSYGPHVSEELIAAALHPYSKDLVIATKCGIVRPAASEWVAEGRPVHLRSDCEGSLRRLRVERIDLYYLHAVDPQVPVEESVGELVKLQQEGKIRHIGLSNVDALHLRKAQAVAKIASVQNLYNVARRDVDDSQNVLAICEKEDIAFVAHTPLARRNQRPDRRNTQVDALEKVAQQRGITMAQAALAWVLTRSPVTLPIPGTSSIQHMEENVAAAGLGLNAEEMMAIG